MNLDNTPSNTLFKSDFNTKPSNYIKNKTEKDIHKEYKLDDGLESSSEIEANIPIWIQFLLSGTIVTIVQYLAQNVSYKYASILYSLPYTFLILFTIYSINNFPRDRIVKFAFNTILSLANIAFYSYSFKLLQKYTKLSIVKSLIFAFIPWFLFALIIYFEPYEEYAKKYIL